MESVDATQMGIVLRKVPPEELESRGVADPEQVCEATAEVLARGSFDVAPDRAGSAAATIGRFGS